MSVNIFKKGQTPDLLQVANKGYNANWTGTKEAAEKALAAGEIKNGTLVYITDDYNTNDSVVHADTADKALVADRATEADHAADSTKLNGHEDSYFATTAKIYDRSWPFFKMEGNIVMDLDELFNTGAYIYANAIELKHIPGGTSPQFGCLVISISAFNTFKVSSFGSPGIQIYLPAWGKNGAYNPSTQMFMRRSYWDGGGSDPARDNVKWTQWKQIDFQA